MSSKKRARRRTGLLAGSSLVAASLGAAVFTGAAVAPTIALAYDECAPANPPVTQTDGVNGVSDPTLNGAIADSFACSTTPYATGVTYTSSGDLTVTKTNTGATTVTANGVNLTGVGSDSVTWDSSAGGITGGAGTNGPVIDVTSVSGDISITTNGVTATQAGTTHGIRATSSGGGNITTVGSVNNNNASGQAAIEAVTNGGDISITTGQGFTTGRLRGIVAQTSGAGKVTINTPGQVTANATDGVAAISVTAETGAATINMTRGTVSGGAGKAIVVSSAGSVTINNSGGTIGTGSFAQPTIGGVVDFSAVTGPGVVFDNTGATASTGRWLVSGASAFSAGNDTLGMTGIGENVISPTASIDFGVGDDTFNMGAFLNVGGFSDPSTTPLDFGAGDDTFNMSGVMVTGAATFANLEAFNNSGVIYLGSYNVGGNSPPLDWTRTDAAADDRLSLPGTTFTGSGSSRIVMDVNLGGGAQLGCATMTGAGDCLYLPGGATAGVTLITVNNLAPDAKFAGYDPVGITLVDVAGGTSAAGDFVLDPSTPGVVSDPLLGAAIDRPGLFRYVLRYDAGTQRHAIVGLPRSEPMEYAMLPSAAQSVWQTTTDTVLGRQRSLRSGAAGEVWLLAGGEYSKRDVDAGFESFGETFTTDGSYKLYAGTIIGGMDLLSGTSGGYDYVLGAQLGYVGSSFDLNASESSGRFTGATGGIYGSVWSDSFFIDTTFNTNFLTLDYDQPGLGSKTNTWLRSVGAQAEAGLRYRLGERFYAEPLATASFAYATFEEISLAGGEIRPDEAQSRRAALGLRVGADYPGRSVNWSYFLTGRAWNEFDGESRVVVNNPGADLVYGDDFSGTFSEFEAGLSLANDAGTVSGFLSSGVKAKDGYSAVDLSTGLRLRW